MGTQTLDVPDDRVDRHHAWTSEVSLNGTVELADRFSHVEATLADPAVNLGPVPGPSETTRV